EQLVFFQLNGTASSPADYLPLSSPALIPAGSSFVDLDVWPVNDSTEEPDETVVLTLLQAPGAQIGTPAVATVTLHDDDHPSLPVVTVEAIDALASEPGTDTAQFAVRRTGPTNEELIVSFTWGGTAVAGIDFLNIDSTVVIPAGATQAVVTVTPRADFVFELDETIVLTLTQLPSYRVGQPASARAILVDNEIGVSVVATGVALEGSSVPGTFVITRTGDVTAALIVHYAIGGTAAFEDFVSVPGFVQI